MTASRSILVFSLDFADDYQCSAGTSFESQASNSGR